MKHFFLFLLCLAGTTVLAQKPHQPSAAELFQQVKKLEVLGNVLYLAAHPDDENTRFISYSANERLYNTAYLSLTRGDGGQNLVGPEISEELGIIRTQELLAARRVDGGQQYFSRAIDFGYSKTSSETQAIWNRDKVLSDVVWVIRKFRPDVIVLRFPPDSRGGHGHHTASAELGIEAFSLAADEKAYPEQLKHVSTWQTTRIVTNTGRWWRKDISADEEGVTVENTGPYIELLGQSANEIASRSRSQHKSQGFGSTGRRGEQLEYFEAHKGAPAETSLFEGITTDWSRVKGSEAVQKAAKNVVDGFKIDQPAASIPALIALRSELEKMSNEAWAAKKIEEVNQLVIGCAGLYMEVKADDFAASEGDSLKLDFELINRSSASVKVVNVACKSLNINKPQSIELANNDKKELVEATVLPAGLPYSQPYWLERPGEQGIYSVEDQLLIGQPENKPALNFTIDLDIEGKPFSCSIPVIYKWNDPVKGELYRPFVITPPVYANFSEPIYIFTQEARTMEVVVKSGTDNFKGDLTLTAPDGWTLSQATWPINLETKGAEQRINITVTPSKKAANGPLKASIAASGSTYTYALRTIEYDHIPTQVWFPQAQTKLAYIDLKCTAKKVGYIVGAGDNVPRGLQNIGIEVTELAEIDLTPENLKNYDAIMLGIRALNTNERIGFMIPALLEYVKAGGTFVIQYNTAHRLKTTEFGPYPLKLSRDRVTEEDAEVTFLAPDHAVLNTPNKIIQADFDGWVQERGLYFPNEWDEKYTPILSWHDKDEDAKTGSLLVTEYGDGHFVYTGISFFRELPAGVPGAFRLLTNLISLGNE